MATNYDEFYRDNPDGLGAPTKALIRSLTTHLTPPARVLDVGCGQGRDALPLARLGHHVTGVDLSPHGIADMLNAAKREGLAVTGVTADLATYTPEGRFDALLFDRTLHMLDEAPRHAALARLLPCLTPGGHLFVVDEKRNMAGLCAVIDAAGLGFETLSAKGGTYIARRAP